MECDINHVQAHRATLAASLSLRRIFSAGIDLLFPPRCAGCGKVDTRWCGACAEKLNALPIDLQHARLQPFAAATASGIHQDTLKHAIHALKFMGEETLALPLSDRLARSIALLGWRFDLIAPIPLHPLRTQKRGYNQSRLIAETLARMLNIPCDAEALERTRDTPPQVGRDRAARRENVAGAFRADPERVGGARLLLIDDVFTTGATLQACASAALAGGAKPIYALTVTAAPLLPLKGV